MGYLLYEFITDINIKVSVSKICVMYKEEQPSNNCIKELMKVSL